MMMDVLVLPPICQTNSLKIHAEISIAHKSWYQPQSPHMNDVIDD